eukprot:Skav221153  [mRNA]  locus=scaffold2925:197297:198467:+ [translate_table: standard]
MEAASSAPGVKVKKERIESTPVARRRGLTRRHWPNKLKREVASVKKERIDGAEWLQVRERLEKLVGGANLQTQAKEEMFLANVMQEVQQLIQQKKVDTSDFHKAAKAVKTGAVQFNVLSGTWTKLGRHAAHGEDAVVTSPGEPAAPPAEWPKPARFRRNNLRKQSGVSQVNWNKTMMAWQADAAALEAAKAFRTELVQQGVLSEPKPQDPDLTSEVPGVAWHKQVQKWQVQIWQKGGKKTIQGGYFTEKAAAEAKALELREQHGLERQVKAVSTLAELPIFHPKVPYPGVSWHQGAQQWLAQCRVAGANRSFPIRPKDHSEKELERTFKKAVNWKKKQEKERMQAKKPRKAKAPFAKKRQK